MHVSQHGTIPRSRSLGSCPQSLDSVDELSIIVMSLLAVSRYPSGLGVAWLVARARETC